MTNKIGNSAKYIPDFVLSKEHESTTPSRDDDARALLDQPDPANLLAIFSSPRRERVPTGGTTTTTTITITITTTTATINNQYRSRRVPTLKSTLCVGVLRSRP
ncbi:hypothetical protein M0804_010619 [Polistes exclamans]|nr:hypothetical protein M0804_010619 [Polistes exclamans]